MNIEFRFELGRSLRDTVSGIEGTATAASIALSGRKRYCLERIVDGQFVDHWLDEDRLDVAKNRSEIGLGDSLRPREEPK